MNGRQCPLLRSRHACPNDREGRKADSVFQGASTPRIDQLAHEGLKLAQHLVEPKETAEVVTEVSKLCRRIASKVIAGRSPAAGTTACPAVAPLSGTSPSYCATKFGSACTWVTGGGFHLPVSTAGLGA